MSYRYASVVRLLEYDPRNDVDPGQIYIVEGKNEDGYSRTVMDDDIEGFRDLRFEVLGRIGPTDYPMSKDEVTSWAAKQDEALDIVDDAGPLEATA